MKTVLLHILLAALLPIIALVILFWLAQDWWEGREIGSMDA